MRQGDERQVYACGCTGFVQAVIGNGERTEQRTERERERLSVSTSMWVASPLD